MNTISHWIDGGASTAPPAKTGPVYNPARGEVAACVAMGGAGEVDAAVAAARRAFADWRSTPLSRRTEVLFRFRSLLAAHLDELAHRIVREHGKVLSDARGEVRRGLDVVITSRWAPPAAGRGPNLVFPSSS